MFEPINHKVRAAKHRKAAREAEAYGLPGLAEVDWAMAELLDPTPREKPVENRRQQRGHNKPGNAQRNGSVNGGVSNGQGTRGTSTQGAAVNAPQRSAAEPTRLRNVVVANGGQTRGHAQRGTRGAPGQGGAARAQNNRGAVHANPQAPRP